MVQNFMRKVSILLTLLLSSPLFAQEFNEQEANKLVTQKECLKCHKPYSTLNTPRLHGAEKEYLVKQLHAFKEGKRSNIFMQGVVQKLTEQDIDTLTTYFSRFDPCTVELLENIGPGNPKKGEAKVTVCQGCHVKGNQFGAPLLYGQDGLYLAAQLRDVKYGRRENPAMFNAVKDLSDNDIIDIAAYYSSINTCTVPKKVVFQPTVKVTWQLPEKLVKRLDQIAKEREITTNDFAQKALDQYLKFLEASE